MQRSPRKPSSSDDLIRLARAVRAEAALTSNEARALRRRIAEFRRRQNLPDRVRPPPGPRD